MQTPPAKTERERVYIAAPPPQRLLPPRKSRVSRPASMLTRRRLGKLYEQYPDVDSGAFYALSLLAAEQPLDDTGVTLATQSDNGAHAALCEISG